MTQDILLPDFEAAPATPGASGSLNLKFGTDEEFARLRTLFQEVGYTERGVCARVGCPDMSRFVTRLGVVIEDALEVCIQLFLEGEPVARSMADKLLPPGAPAFLTEFGLLAPDPGDPGNYVAPLSLYEAQGLYLISDQTVLVAGTGGRTVPDDVVYPAIQATTAEFLEAMPNTHCERLLDICSGTGVAALYAASTFADHAWAVDITERSTQVCEFNARLNGVENVTALTGDLFAPVAGLTFDRIVAHPPYMPATENKVIFRDGGEDGEQLTRRIIEALPDHLARGGRFYCRCMATDRQGAPLEERLRALLGPRHEEFDILIVFNVEAPPALFYSRLVARGSMTPAEYARQVEVLKTLAVEKMVIGFISIERRPSSQAAVTLRRCIMQRRSPAPAEIDWGLAWERAQNDPGLLSRLLSARPVLSPFAEVQLKHRMHAGQLRAEQCTA
ncbi:MAG: methyltransferase, partial [Pseudomonas sp.]